MALQHAGLPSLEAMSEWLVAHFRGRLEVEAAASGACCSAQWGERERAAREKKQEEWELVASSICWL